MEGMRADRQRDQPLEIESGRCTLKHGARLTLSSMDDAQKARHASRRPRYRNVTHQSSGDDGALRAPEDPHPAEPHLARVDTNIEQ